GCYSDTRDQRSLTGKMVLEDEMTVDRCAYECRDYAWFGVEYGTQCFCGTKLQASAHRKPEHECAQPCGGDHLTLCGDADRLNVYVRGSGGSGGDLHMVGGFGYKGCWTDSLQSRSLGGLVLYDDKMTVELCARYCQGHKFMGVEYGSQCFCADHLGGYAAQKWECSELCYGNKDEWCGGPLRLSLYE
ncbi:carbohydrate-binding WSC, partial [Podospora didyma]